MCCTEQSDYVRRCHGARHSHDNGSTSNITFHFQAVEKFSDIFELFYYQRITNHRIADKAMQSARRAITSGSKVREVDLYSGFNKNVVNLFDSSTNEDEAYQNALRISSYGKRNTTPKTNWVSLATFHFGI